MKNNRILAVILSFMMLFSFAACGKDDSAKETKKAAATTSAEKTAKKSTTTSATTTTITVTSTATTKKSASTATTKKAAANSNATTTTAKAVTTAAPATAEVLPAFSITVNGKTISNSNTAALTVYEKEVTVSSKGEISTNKYKGYKLIDILALAGATSYASGIEVKATDGYTSSYTKAQIDDPNTILAITKNGTNTDCPVLAPCSETTANGYAKFVSTITIK